MTPESSGEITHDAMIAESPPLHAQLRQSALVPTSVMPTTPPTMA